MATHGTIVVQERWLIIMNIEKVLVIGVGGAITALIILDLVSSPNTAPILGQLSNGVSNETNILAGNIPSNYRHNPTA